MITFRPFPEIKLDSIHPDTGEIVVSKANGTPFFATVEYNSEDDIKRLVDCWNACRKLYSPAAHIAETDAYVMRLETLRKEAWARVKSESPATEDAA